jgi:two-component system, cell cycle sensor histidine kinase and response regulator CckA
MLTDVIMTGINGINGRTLMSRLEAKRPDIKAFYISGYADNAIMHYGVLDPNAAFLQKPFSAESLARKVREVLDS